MTSEELEAWVLDYVEKKGVVMGWDWEADLTFAKAIEADPETIKLIERGVKGAGPATFVAYRSKPWQDVKKARLRLMKRLTDQGKLKAHWAGLPSSVTGGATRTRAWEKS